LPRNAAKRNRSDRTPRDYRGAFTLWRVVNEPLPRYVADVDQDAALRASQLLSGIAEILHDNGVEPPRRSRPART